MPGATVARLVSCACEIAAKLAMIPQTVPNRPTNGATDEMTARLGRPPSDRVRSSRAARAMEFGDARPHFADRLAGNAAMRLLVAGGGDDSKRLARSLLRRARRAPRAGGARPRSRPRRSAPSTRARRRTGRPSPPCRRGPPRGTARLATGPDPAWQTSFRSLRTVLRIITCISGRHRPRRARRRRDCADPSDKARHSAARPCRKGRRRWHNVD